MDDVQLACPYCAEHFRAAAAAETRTTRCPHCSRQITVPAAPHPAVPPAPPPRPDQSPPSEIAQPAADTPAAGQSAAGQSAATVKPRSKFNLAEPAKTVVNRRGETVPLRRLSPAERARFRRRLNWACAAIGMAILSIALVVLLRLRP